MIRSLDELSKYLDNDRLYCFECGRSFSLLGQHVRRAHGLSPDEFRDKWGIPRTAPLAGLNLRAKRRDIAIESIATGRLVPAHTKASEAASGAERGKQGWVRAAHAARIAELRPGDHSLLPPGAKRADGRDAGLAREYQRKRRARPK